MLKHVAFFGGMSAIAITLALAEDVRPGISGPTPVLADRTFEPFGLWAKIQLGATSLVNPSVAKDAAIVYSYTPSQITQIDELLKSSKVILAKPAGGDNWKPMTTQEASDVLMDTPAQIDRNARVFSSAALPGVPTENQFIGWRY